MKHAHSSVEQAYNEISNFDQEWKEALENESLEVHDTRKLVGIIRSIIGFDKMDEDKRNEIFRYFGTASIYAKSMLDSSIANT